MPPKFGTSGLRGLATELTDPLIREHIRAFLAVANASGTVHVGRDLRSSSPRIARAVIEAAAAFGLDVVDHGTLPTPALALTSMAASEVAIMVTGSHIPGDRNGLKFYTAKGEIQKHDEVAILSRLGEELHIGGVPGKVRWTSDATTDYRARYIKSFGKSALSGLRIGVYEHSSVARDVMADVLAGLGANVVRLARSKTFIPVDTEAVDVETRERLAGWCGEYGLDALVSTDGDADRPMVADSTGTLVPGDILGPLTARYLGAEVICTPVSSNTMVELMGDFSQVRRTRIGSPYVIAEMKAVVDARVAGYEANGGFLLGFEAEGLAGRITPLMTRDSLLPIVTTLAAIIEEGVDLSEIVRALPPRFTASDRLTDIPNERSSVLLMKMVENPEFRNTVLGMGCREAGTDLTDGLRVQYDDGSIIHLRASGNAPEFRCYVDARSAERAEALLRLTLGSLQRVL